MEIVTLHHVQCHLKPLPLAIRCDSTTTKGERCKSRANDNTNFAYHIMILRRLNKAVKDKVFRVKRQFDEAKCKGPSLYALGRCYNKRAFGKEFCN